MLLSSLFDDPHSRLVEVLSWFFPLILWWTVRRLRAHVGTSRGSEVFEYPETSPPYDPLRVSAEWPAPITGGRPSKNRT